MDWLSLSWPEKNSGDPFFAELAAVLSWPGKVKVSAGGPEGALRALGVGSGDYVVLPNLSPVYWAEAVKAVGADCILIDAHPQNWQIDLDLLEMFLMNYTMLNERDELILKKDSRVIRSLIIPHLLGGLCDLERLEFIVRRFYLALGEDITQALGCSWNGRPAGTFGRVGCCRFEDNPLLPFGEPVLFTTGNDMAGLQGKGEAALSPMSNLANHLGRQFIPRIQSMLEESRSVAQQLRMQENRHWMQIEEACLSNGLATAFLSDDTKEESERWGKLALPLSQQPPFNKSLYIRQENWSEKIQAKAIILSLDQDRS